MLSAMSSPRPFIANPILWADYPDPDIIRVGDWFYMIATSMHIFPGNPILRSKDLVTWSMAGYSLPDFDEHPAYRMAGPSQDPTRYARGPWACSLRHHQGRFVTCFISLTENATFICTAEDPAGPWQRHRLDVLLYDPSFLFADDGRIFVFHNENRPGEPWAIYRTELTADLRGIGPSGTVEVFRPPCYLEGSHAHQIDGRVYVLLNTAGKTASAQWAIRADHVDGPYELRLLLEDDGNVPGLTGMTLHQAGLVQDGAGAWWSIIFQDVVSAGRAPHLLPVTWTDGWPMLGHRGVGLPFIRRPSPLPGPAPEPTPSCDHFDAPALGLDWQWNHLPDPAGWSLTERPGWLRLRPTTVSTDLARDLQRVRNHLTQRVIGPWSTATARLDVRTLTEGDLAGLSVFHKPYGLVGVRVRQGRRELVMINDAALMEVAPVMVPDTVILRAEVDALGHRARFAYSLDGQVFTPIGNHVDLQFNLRHFVGNRFGLFCQATTALGGHADVDWFHLAVGERAVPPATRVLATEATAWHGTQLVRLPAAEGGGHAVRLTAGESLTFATGTPAGPLALRVASGTGAQVILADGQGKPIGHLTVPSLLPHLWSTLRTTVRENDQMTITVSTGSLDISWWESSVS